MPRSTSRATTTQLNSIHRLAARAIERELKAALKEEGAVSPQLLARAIDFLKMTDVTDPEREKRPDELKGRMPDMDALERAMPVREPAVSRQATPAAPSAWDFNSPAK